MTFDEQLQRAFEAMTDRLRDDIARQCRAVGEELSASAEEDRNEVARNARQVAEREADERLSAAVAASETDAMARGRDEGRAEGLAEGRRQGREEGVAVGRGEGWEAGRVQGLEEGRRIGKEDGLHDGLQAGLLQGHRQAEQSSAEALTQAVTAVRAELIAAELAAGGRLVDAVRAMGRAESLSEVLGTLVTCAAQEASRAAILLPSGGRFSGWRFVGFGPSLDGTGLAFADEEAAGVVYEARRTGAAVLSAGTGLEAPAFAELPSGRESLAVPLSMGGEVVAVLYADQGTSESASAAWPDRLELLARHAEQRLATLTAFKAACLVTEHAEPARVPAPPDVRPVESRGDEAAAAQRYARLLVAEIKLYHEAAVIAGRQERDLTTRLGGEIARARALYEQRVPVHVRQVVDHFQVELVRTLANGDDSLLELGTRP